MSEQLALKENMWAVPFEGWSTADYEAFLAYHQAHRWIWQQFQDLALQFVKEGGERWSADNLLHVIRWSNRNAEKKAVTEQWKINNNASSGYARAWARKFPQYAHIFEFRQLQRAA